MVNKEGIQMDKLKMHTPNLVEMKLETLGALFPNCITEGIDETGKIKKTINFDLLRQELSPSIAEGPHERYQLDWVGKKNAIVNSNAPTMKTLRPCREDSVNFDQTENVFIEGDNLDALKLLQETYLGRVKMIYIDPPYNTGNNLIYKNDYGLKEVEYKPFSGLISEDGGKLEPNPETSGRFHSVWLSMIYERLRLAKNLLSPEGVLVCAIDENEFGTLSVLMKEIFSGSAWEHTYVTVIHNPRGQQGKNFSSINEYLIFVYPSAMKAIGNRRIEEKDVSWSQFRNWGGESERKDAKNCFYPVIVADGKIIGFGKVSPDDFHPKQTEWVDGKAYVYPIDNSGVERKWRYALQSVDEIKDMLRAKRTNDGYQIEIGKTFGLYRTVWTDKRYDANEWGSKLVNSLVPNSGFTFPKSLWAVYDPIEAVTANEKNAIIVDFFAGSATTAHAVMQLNVDDGGNRKFIMVQVPENCEDKSMGFRTIAEISKERIRRAAQKIKEENPSNANKVDLGFRAFTIDSSNMKDVYYIPDQTEQNKLEFLTDNIKEERSAEDLLFQVLLDWGIDITLPIRKEYIEGLEVFFVDENALVTCFAKEGKITEAVCKELAKRQPLRIVFRDAGFKNDSTKINVAQLFKLLSPHTDVKTI